MLITISAAAAWVAHILTWAVAALLIFVPTYEGVSYGTTSAGRPEEAVRVTATLIEINGLRVVPLFTVPILTTGFAVWISRWSDARRKRHKCLLWLPAFALLAHCAATIFSVGFLYLPAAFALVVASCAGWRRVERRAETHG